MYSVSIHDATDPRFGGRFKDLLRDAGDIVENDIILIRKFSQGYYDLEIVKTFDSRYKTYFALFA